MAMSFMFFVVFWVYAILQKMEVFGLLMWLHELENMGLRIALLKGTRLWLLDGVGKRNCVIAIDTIYL